MVGANRSPLSAPIGRAARAITLVESARADHRAEALTLLSSLGRDRQALRIGLSGTPGVGKSTLLRGLANSLPGQAVLFKPEYGLRDELLVHDHLQNLLAHLNRAHTDMAHILAQVGLSDWQHERIGTLSSGQKARLGLCTLLASPFLVWLLDEPFVALDSDAVQALQLLLQQHLAKGGALIFTSHQAVQLGVDLQSLRLQA